MVDVVIQTKKKKGKGWHESADYTGKAPDHKAASTKDSMINMLRQPLILADPKNQENKLEKVDEGLYQFITDYYNNELPKRIVWKGKDFSEKTAKIEQKKLGAEWKIALSPYDKDRFVVVKEEPKLPLNKYIDEYKKDLEIIYKQQRAKGKI